MVKRKQREWIELRKRIVADVDAALRRRSYARAELFDLCAKPHGISMELFRGYLSHSVGTSVCGLRVDTRKFLAKLDEQDDWRHIDELLAISSYRNAEDGYRKHPWEEELFENNVAHWWFCTGYGFFRIHAGLQEHSPEAVALYHRMSWWGRRWPHRERPSIPRTLEAWYGLLGLQRPQQDEDGWLSNLTEREEAQSLLRIREAFFRHVPPPSSGRWPLFLRPSANSLERVVQE